MSLFVQAHIHTRTLPATFLRQHVKFIWRGVGWQVAPCGMSVWLERQEEQREGKRDMYKKKELPDLLPYSCFFPFPYPLPSPPFPLTYSICTSVARLILRKRPYEYGPEPIVSSFRISVPRPMTILHHHSCHHFMNVHAPNVLDIPSVLAILDGVYNRRKYLFVCMVMILFRTITYSTSTYFILRNSSPPEPLAHLSLNPTPTTPSPLPDYISSPSFILNYFS